MSCIRKNPFPRIDSLLSTITQQIRSSRPAVSPAFFAVQPQILRRLLLTLGRAIARTAGHFSNESSRVAEPIFTRQLCVDLEVERDQTPEAPRFDVTHQSELPTVDEVGKVIGHGRLDLRILFPQQLGRTGEYLCLECKYLNVHDRATDLAYVREGVDRIVQGFYAVNHPWAVLVGLERSGPIQDSATHVDERLVEQYGVTGGFIANPLVKLANVHESHHLQGGGSHTIAILHAFFMVV